jgi:hypothetical protein
LGGVRPIHCGINPCVQGDRLGWGVDAKIICTHKGAKLLVLGGKVCYYLMLITLSRKRTETFSIG